MNTLQKDIKRRELVRRRKKIKHKKFCSITHKVLFVRYGNNLCQSTGEWIKSGKYIQ